MATLKAAYPTLGQAITITLASLASGSVRESAAVDNQTNLYLDALVAVTIKLQAGSPSSDKAVYVYAAGSTDASTWPDAVTGSDAGITLNNPTQLRLLGVIFAPTSAGTFKSEPLSVASVFGGVLPPKWSIVLLNKTGIAFSATEGDHVKLYTGIAATVA